MHGCNVAFVGIMPLQKFGLISTNTQVNEPQTERATNRTSHKPNEPQTARATNRTNTQLTWQLLYLVCLKPVMGLISLATVTTHE